MTACEACGKDVLMPFECNFCGGYFCDEHRLPENHDCKGAPARTPLGSYQSKQRIPKKEKTKGGMASEGDFHFEKAPIYGENVKRGPYNLRRRRDFRVKP
jgi:hypothetical protein